MKKVVLLAALAVAGIVAVVLVVARMTWNPAPIDTDIGKASLASGTGATEQKKDTVNEETPQAPASPQTTPLRASASDADFLNVPSQARSQPEPNQKENAPQAPEDSEDEEGEDITLKTALIENAFKKSNWKMMKFLICSPGVPDEAFLSIFKDATTEINPNIFTLAANALAVGRFDLFNALMKVVADDEYNIEGKDIEFSGLPIRNEAILLREMSQMPHFTQEAAESTEFKALLEAVNDHPPSFEIRHLQLRSMNLPFFMAFERKFPDHKPAFSINSLDQTQKKYGLTVEDVRPAVRYLQSKRMRIEPSVQDARRFGPLVDMLAEASMKEKTRP